MSRRSDRETPIERVIVTDKFIFALRTLRRLFLTQAEAAVDIVPQKKCDFLPKLPAVFATVPHFHFKFVLGASSQFETNVGSIMKQKVRTSALTKPTAVTLRQLPNKRPCKVRLTRRYRAPVLLPIDRKSVEEVSLEPPDDIGPWG